MPKRQPNRTDGRYVVTLTLPDGRRKYFYGQTWQEAEQKRLEARHLLYKGLPIPGEKLKVGAFLDAWLQEKQEGPKPVRPSTWTRYQDFVRLHIKPIVGNVALAHLTATHVKAIYSAARKKGLSATSVHHLATVLHGALKSAYKDGLVAQNVAERVDKPPMNHPEMKTFTQEEAIRFLESVAGDRLEALYTLALWTGARQGELLALHWHDVDLGAGLLSITASLRYHHRQFDFQPPKTKKGKRILKLAPEVVSALHAHKARQADERLSLGQFWEGAEKREDDLLFPNHFGGPMDASNLLKYCFYPALKRAGLPRIRYHDLRHTFATLQLQANTNPKLVSTILGHSTIAITLDTYSHVTPDMQDAAIEAMQRALKKRSG